MDTLRHMAELITRKERILLFPHVNPDGDAIGSAAALCSAMRKTGKTAYVLIEEETADNLRFMENGFFVRADGMSTQKIIKDLFEGEAPDLCLCIDCGSEDRFEKRKDIYRAGIEKACIDHHKTTAPVWDHNYIDPGAAATGEIIYDLIRILEEIYKEKIMDKKIGEALFAAITTDTGNFQYSNTTKASHDKAGSLIDEGIDFAEVSARLYQSVSPGKIKLESMAVERMEIFAGGKAAITYVTEEMAEQAGALMNDTGGIIDTVRSIKGVEVAVFLKELEKDDIKAGLRAKSYADVAKIALKFGGGGHVKAAGCTLNMSLEEARETMMREVTEALASDDQE